MKVQGGIADYDDEEELWRKKSLSVKLCKEYKL